MRILTWAAVAIAGFTLMVVAYTQWLRPDPEAPWSSGFLSVGSGEPAEKFDAGSVLLARLRYLPPSESTESLIKGIETSIPGRGPALRARLSRKLIELPVGEMGPLGSWLREGRMPEPGKGEALGGSESGAGEEFNVAGRSLKVVGVLVSSVALFADSVLVPADPAADALFAGDDPMLSRVRIVRLTAQQFRDRKLHEQLAKAFPSKGFVNLPPQVRPETTGFSSYLAGQALFLIGGTGVLAGLYRGMARSIRWRLLAEPLAEIIGRPRLFWATHIIYFGLYILMAALIRTVPALHTVLMTSVQQAFTGEGPLAVAGAAYLSGNILWAAAVTFAVNFLLGTIVMITLPSLIIPGVGVLVAVFRATLWGLLLGPADVSLALGMIPHSGTLLLEGEGYILATFFAMLMPVILFGSGRPALKPAEAVDGEFADPPSEPTHETTGRRFLRAIGLNLKGLLLVALVLAVAAIYEAAEVIWMAGF